MKSENSLNEQSPKSQETPISPYDAEFSPIRFDVRKWHKGVSQANVGYADAMSWAMDKIFGDDRPNHDNDFDNNLGKYEKDMMLMGKQHLMVQGLTCQNGCKEMATEKMQSESQDGRPIDLLVCEECAFGGVNE